MVDRDTYLKIVAAAHIEAQRFASKDFVAQDFLKQLPGEPRVPALLNFIENYHKITVMPFGNRIQRGYSSWLFSMGGDRKRIAYDREQVREWANGQIKAIFKADTQDEPRQVHTSEFLTDLVTARSILHELGHFLLSTDLVRSLDRSPVGTKRWATAQEEENAWVFTFCFLGLILGQYARETRLENESHDDAPKILI